MNRPYLRCSTDEQTTDSQRHAADLWLKSHPGEVSWYDDGGWSGIERKRPDYQRMLKEVKPGDTVLVYALDRLTREGITATLQLREMFKERGVKLVSLSEPWVSDEGPMGELVTAIMAWAASQERLRIKARQKAGIDAIRAKNQGKCTWGGRKKGRRNKKTQEKIGVVMKLKESGCLLKDICKITGLNPQTVRRLISQNTPYNPTP